jgi:hypothetical protein
MSVVDQLYFNYILLYVGGCRVIWVGGYVWARCSCYGGTLIVLALIVNTHLAEVFSLSISVGVILRLFNPVVCYSNITLKNTVSQNTYTFSRLLASDLLSSHHQNL